MSLVTSSPPSGPHFVDIHSHILPGLDDGARTMEESLQMLRLAAASGTTDIVATPHASSQFAYDEQRITQVFHELQSQSAGLIRLHLGCDFHLNLQNLDDALAHPARYTVNRTQYLMVELPDFLGLSTIRDQLQTLIHARICPVITHPERNLSLQSNLAQVKQWVADGCLTQVTAQSLLGAFGTSARRAAESLMNAGFVHFIASDAHDCERRPPDLSAAYQHVARRWGKARAKALFADNPMALISGDLVDMSYKNHKIWAQSFGFFRLLRPRRKPVR